MLSSKLYKVTKSGISPNLILIKFWIQAHKMTVSYQKMCMKNLPFIWAHEVKICALGKVDYLLNKLFNFYEILNLRLKGHFVFCSAALQLLSKCLISEALIKQVRGTTRCVNSDKYCKISFDLLICFVSSCHLTKPHIFGTF